MIWLLATLAVSGNPQTSNVPYPVVANQATYLALELVREQMQLAVDESLFGGKHPRLVQSRQRVEAIEALIGEQEDAVDQGIVDSQIDAEIARREAELAALRTNLAETHPRIVMLTMQLEQFKNLKSAPAKGD